MSRTTTRAGRRPCRACWVRRVIALAGLLACGAVSALSADQAIRDFKFTTWSARDGAPTAATAIAQTADGHLWIGGPGGLVRFDGLHFEHVDLPRDRGLSSASVFSLFAPATGGLWIGFQFGAVALLKDGVLTVYTEQNGLPAGSVTALALDHDGAMWAGTSTGLARLEGSRWSRVGPERGYSDTQTAALFVDSAGTLWSLSRNKTLSLRRGEAAFREADKKLGGGNIFGVAESAAGEVWSTDGTALSMLAKNPNPERRSTSTGLALLFDRDGSLWGSGPWERGDSLFRIGRPEGMKDTSWAQAKVSMPSYSGYKDAAQSGPVMLEDREGNVWLTSPGSIARISERNVATVPLPAAGASALSAGIAAGERGALWLIDRLGRTFTLTDGTAVAHDDMGRASCVIAGANGSIWLGSSEGVWNYAAGRIERFPFPFDTGGFEVQAMALDRAGELWVAIPRKGVYKLSSGQWLPSGGVKALPKLPVVTLATDAAGRIWFGYTEGRVAVLDGADVRLFSDPGHAGVGNVTALYARRSRVWVGGEFGLAVFDKTGLRAVMPGEGQSFNSVTGLVETEAGDLWVNGRDGIVHFSAAEARRAAEEPEYRPRGELFDSFDGVEGSSARLRPLPSAIEGSDSRMWFLTDSGLYAIDPKRIHRNPLSPTVSITSLTAGNRSWTASDGAKLAPGTTAVRIDYVALSLTQAEKVRYRYKLAGVDADWQDAQARRQAFYNGLRPGRHRFQVIAANNDGIWNETGAALEFVIPPTFVQTGWFIALCAAGLVLLTWLAAWLRVRHVAARMRGGFAERMAERERIARELHDTLLQSTHGLVLRFQAVANRVAADDPNRAMLNEALERADTVMEEGRDRVLDLRLPADSLRDLPEAFAVVGEEAGQARAVAFHTIVEGAPRALQPLAKDEIYRIGREALLNAFRHAQASSIEVQLIYAADTLRVRIRDDGVGVDAQVLDTGSRPNHWGLQGMRERAKRIGAKLDVWSRPGAGTEVEVTVPAASAYAQAHRPRWLPIPTVFGKVR